MSAGQPRSAPAPSPSVGDVHEVVATARFAGVLFGDGMPIDARARPEMPAYFADLNLDQVVESITAGREEYELEPLFWAPLQSADAIAYRHEVFRDLEDVQLAARVRAFGDGMREMRKQLANADKLREDRQRQRWFLDAVGTYCEAVSRLAADLESLELRSRGLLGFRGHLARYVQSGRFRSLRGEAAALADQLARIRYSVQIHGRRVTVRPDGGEADFGRAVEETFDRFRRGATRDYRARLASWLEMDHVETQVLQGVAELHPHVFAALASFCERRGDYLDEAIRSFDRDVQFYLAYLEHAERLEPGGLRFCYPAVSPDSKEVRARTTFDLALAAKLVADGSPVVCNDFHLEGPERILVVTGPNQGGKTTFARTFGQVHHLASLGCPVPGTEAQLFLFDALFSHFEKEEDLGDLTGKLFADLQRIKEILEQATPRSLVVLNESLSSTTLSDALFLNTRVLERIIELDLLCVCVTFIEELASLGNATVSMVSAIVPGNPALRTYKIERRPADGIAYAAVIAAKYGLTYETLKDRIGS